MGTITTTASTEMYGGSLNEAELGYWKNLSFESFLEALWAGGHGLEQSTTYPTFQIGLPSRWPAVACRSEYCSGNGM